VSPLWYTDRAGRGGGKVVFLLSELSVVRAVRAVVRGRVQGVGYRQATRVAARGLGLHGWVRNTPEGTVEVFAQGDDEAVNRLVEWLWMGPTGGGVAGVESDVVPIDTQLHDFFIRQ
jgi:acylphosphatase